MRLLQEKCDIFQSAKKVMSDSPGLVHVLIASRLVIFVLILHDRQVPFLGKFKLQKDCNQSY